MGADCCSGGPGNSKPASDPDSACCGGPSNVTDTTANAPVSAENEHAGARICCTTENCGLPNLDDCCDGNDNDKGTNCAATVVEEACCDGKAKDACCDGSDESSLNSVATTCCGTEERCDEKCIVSVATKECEKACDADSAHHAAPGHQHEHDEHGHHTTTAACNDHLKSAFDRYAAYIEQARCICRSILESGLGNTACCSTKKPEGTATKKSSARAGKKARGRHHHHHRDREHNHDHAHAHAHGATEKKHDEASHVELIDDILIESTTAEKTKNCCSGDNDDAHDLAFNWEKAPAQGRVRAKEADPEYDASGTEAVAIFVNGMDCSGCGDKLTRVLKASPGVSQVRVNFVMSNADFSLDLSVATVEQVLRSTEAATGFRCTRIAGGGDHTLDVLASQDNAQKLLADYAKGVTDVSLINKGVIRLTYDPAVIGARHLFESLDDRVNGLAAPSADPALSSGRKRLYDQIIKTSLAAALTIPVVVLAWGDTLVDENTKGHVSLVLGFLVQLIAVPEFYRPAISSLIYSHVLEMDMLVCISITAAFVYSVVAYSFRMAGNPLQESEFFETSTLLITLILLGRLIATYARVKAVSAVSLRSMQSNTAVLVENGKDREIDARLLQYGDEFKVPPHTRVPTDGLVVDGSTEIDESMLTGEPMPVVKRTGDHIIAGTVNGGGTIVAKLTRLPGKNTVTDIAQMVEEAANSKPRLQDLANKVASWFVPVVTVLSVIILVVWILIGLKGREWESSRAVANALTYWVAVLAVSCPCALGLAVPMVLVIAGGIAARGGIIIKSAECTERARKCTDVIFDKTGTITEGSLDVVEEELLSSSQDDADADAVSIAKVLTASGKHPVSAAVEKYLENRDVPALSTVQDIRVVPGAGIEANLGKSVLRAGHPQWTQTEDLPAVTRLQDQGLTTLVITRDNQPLIVFGLRTQLRPEAARVIAQLKAQNISVHLVSGDQTRAVEAVAESVGIPRENVAAERTPGDKRNYVASVMQDPKKYVLFCGDGTNDAVAVAQAHVGAQMGGALSSSDVTQGAADVILLAGLEGIPFLLRVSQVSFNRMVFNFVWSAVYNVIAILMAGGAFVYIRIPPAYAGLGEIVSVLPVIFAALSMLLLNLRQKA